MIVTRLFLVKAQFPDQPGVEGLYVVEAESSTQALQEVMRELGKTSAALQVSPAPPMPTPEGAA